MILVQKWALKFKKLRNFDDKSQVYVRFEGRMESGARVKRVLQRRRAAVRAQSAMTALGSCDERIVRSR